MDRNLGATRKANGSESYATCGGLLYQWGRKDPFIGAINVGTNPVPFDLYGKTGSTKFAPPTYVDLTTAATLTTTSVTNDPYIKRTTAASWAEKFKYSVAYPALFIYDWYGSTSKDGTSTNDGRDSWGGEYNQPKAIYDPCPEGWRVPSAKRSSSTATSPFNVWSASTWSNGTAADKNTGYIANGSASMSLPLMGFRGTDASFSNAAYCYIYIATAAAANSLNAMAFSNGVFSTASAMSKCAAGSVRCVKEW